MADTEATPTAAPEITPLESATVALKELRDDIGGMTEAKKDEAIAAFKKGREYVEQGTAEALANFQKEVTRWKDVLGTAPIREDFINQLRNEVLETTSSLLENLKSGTKNLAAQVQEDGLFGSIGKWSEGLFKNVKMPDFMKGMGINNVSDMGDAVSRLAKKAYFSFMTTVGQYVPDWARGMMESQVESAKETLIELAAEDGVRDAVKILQKDAATKGISIPWDNVTWVNWRTAFDATRKTNPTLSARIFVRQHILNEITKNKMTKSTPTNKDGVPRIDGKGVLLMKLLDAPPVPTVSVTPSITPITPVTPVTPPPVTPPPVTTPVVV